MTHLPKTNLLPNVPSANGVWYSAKINSQQPVSKATRHASRTYRSSPPNRAQRRTRTRPTTWSRISPCTHVALCGTDFAIWDDNYLTELPLVQGHEFTGVIEAIDSKASDLTVGTPVAISPMVYCGTCGPCRAGRYNV